MIQRVQTIFLFLAAAAALAVYALPFATTPEPQVASALFTDADFDVQDGPVMMGAFALSAVLFLVAIFLFNNRLRQMMMSKLGLLVAAVGTGVGAYRFYADQAAGLAEPALGVALPIVVFILGTLAHRYINKDEKLVKSIDRLR